MVRLEAKQTKETFQSYLHGKEVNFRSYTFSPPLGVAEIELYAYLGGSTIQITNDEVPINILTWLAIVSLPLSLNRKWESSETTPSVFKLPERWIV